MPCSGNSNHPLMKDFLKPVPELDFDASAHKYRYKGKWLPLSPSTVLSYQLSEHAKKCIEDTRDGPDGWEVRGNTLHQCLEQYLRGAAELSPGDFGAWWEPLRDSWLWQGATVLGVELRMTDMKLMGGSCDFVIKKDDQVILGDLKTVASEKAVNTRKPATAQLGAYMMMLSKCYPKLKIDKCVTVVAGPGRTRVITDDPDQCWIAWEHAQGLYQAHVDGLGF